MRRNDREISAPDIIEKFIAGERIIRIAFVDGGDIYIVPVNYGYTLTNGNYTFYFHGAAAGRKFELAQNEPTVGFEIDGAYKLLEADNACDFSAEFMSVIGTGRLKVLTEKAEKTAALNMLMKQNTGRGDWDFDEKTLKATAVYELAADKLSCKAK